MVLKLEVGVPSGKLKNPPKSCIPKRANIKMKRNNRKSRDKMEEMAFIRAMTKFRKEDQYLKHSVCDVIIRDICSRATAAAAARPPTLLFLFP